MMLSTCWLRGVGRGIANRARAVAQAQRAMSVGSSKELQPIEMLVSDELLSRLTDKELLHTCGFIGGKWLQATDRTTYQVGVLSRARHRGCGACACVVHAALRSASAHAASWRTCALEGAGDQPSHRQAHCHDAQDER